MKNLPFRKGDYFLPFYCSFFCIYIEQRRNEKEGGYHVEKRRENDAEMEQGRG